MGEVGGFSFRELFKRLGCGREAVISKGVFVLLRFQSFSHIGFSHQRLDADDEFLDCEWFFKVVVGSQFEASDNIVRGGFGRDEEHGVWSSVFLMRRTQAGVALTWKFGGYTEKHREAVDTGRFKQYGFISTIKHIYRQELPLSQSEVAAVLNMLRIVG